MSENGSGAAGIVLAYEAHLTSGGLDTPSAYLTRIEQDDAGLLAALEVAYAIHQSPREEPSLGPYRLGPEIGRGAQGVVHAAVDTRLGRRVALKLLRKSAVETEEALQRFQREAEAAGRIDHPNVCTVYETGVHAGQPFIAMQYVAGPPLSTAFSGETLSSSGGLARRLHCIEGIARGLSAAHAAGLIHRDVKPGNILLTAEGSPVLVDFGLARLEDGVDAGLTRTGDLRGTPAYMAPEQLRDAGTVDARTDVYSLGVVLYEVVSGERPFGGTTWNELFHKILTDEPRRPARCPADLWIVLETALAKDPNGRYASAADLAEDLRRVRMHEPILARPVGPWTRLRRWTRRHPAAAIAIVIVLGAALAIAWQEHRAAQRLETEITATKDARERADRRTYLANLRAADASLANQDVTEARRRLLDCPENRRGWEWHYLHTGLDESLETVTAHVGPVRDIAWSADGKRMVSVGDDGRVRVQTVGSTEPARVLSGHGENQVICAAFSPDGRQLATGGEGGEVVLWRPDGTIESRLKLHGEHVWSLTYTPDGALLLSGSTENSLAVYDLRAGRLRHLFEGQPGTVRTIVAARSSAHAWIGTTLGHTLRVDLRTGATRLLVRYDAQVWHARLMGARLIVGLSDRTARVLDLNTGRDLVALRGHKRRVTRVEVLDAERVATASLDGTIRVWDVRTGANLRTLLGHGGSVRCLSWNPHTAELMSGGDDGGLRRWLIAPPIARVRSTHGAVKAAGISFHPDGRTLAASGSSGWAFVHDTWTGDLRRIVRGHGAGVTGVAHTPDGATLVTSSLDGHAYIWDPRTGALRHRVGGGPPLHALAMHPRGGQFAVAGAEGCVRVYDIVSGAPIAIHAAGVDRIHDLAFGPEGRLLLIARARTLAMHDVHAGTERWSLSMPAAHVAYSPDGEVIAIARGRNVELRRAKDGALQSLLEGHEQSIDALAYHPDGSRLATGGSDQTVRLWDTRDGATVAVLRQATSWVRAVAWSRDGTTLASASSDRSLQLWHAARPLGFHAAMRTRWKALREAEPVVAALYADGEPMPLVVEALERRSGLPPPVQRAALHLAQMRTRSDDLSTARGVLRGLVASDKPTTSERAEIAAREVRIALHDPGRLDTFALRALALLRSGDAAGAERIMDELLRETLRAGAAEPALLTRLVHALLLLAEGDVASAEAEYERAKLQSASMSGRRPALERALLGETQRALQSAPR